MNTRPSTRYASLWILVAALALLRCDDDDSPTTPNTAPRTESMSVFVSSTTSATGNLGGLAAADARCQSLAAAVGAGNRTWRAYLSVAQDPADPSRSVDARSRIGDGPWHNASGVLVAATLDELHARKGDANVFLDEHGMKINGQWAGSPVPNEHDILTGSTQDGRVMAGLTCGDWTSDSASLKAQVGHSDGLGPNMSAEGTLSSWNSAHDNMDCSNTAPRGGAGKIYCFAAD